MHYTITKDANGYTHDGHHYWQSYRACVTELAAALYQKRPIIAWRTKAARALARRLAEGGAT